MMDDLEFAVWFAAAADAGWEPRGPAARLDDTSLVHMPAGAAPLSQTVASLARSASAMHDAMLALAFADPEDRMDASGMAEATLARVAIESLATGLWLMLPSDDQQRQRRYVSYVLSDVDDKLRFGDALSDERSSTALTKPFWKINQVKPASTMSILKGVDDEFDTTYQLAWRLYSGLAHGRPWATDAWQRNVPAESDSHFGRIMNMLREPLGLARRYREVADLRRRFAGQTPLEVERLERLRVEGPDGFDSNR